MGIHSQLFLLNSTVFTVFGLLAIFAPQYFLNWLFPSVMAAQAAKYVPLFTLVVRFLGCAHVLMASILCTASQRVSVDMCRSLGAGFAISAAVIGYYYLPIPGTSNTALGLPESVGVSVLGFHALNALLHFALSSSAPRPPPTDSISAKVGSRKTQ